MSGEYHWPAPAYPPLYVWEQLSEAWNNMLEQSRGVDKLDDASGAEWVLGLMASWVSWGKLEPRLDARYVDEIRAHISPAEELAVTVADTLTQILSSAADRHPWHRQLRAWARVALVAFSTPTMSGVTEQFAEQLRETLDSKDSETLRVARSQAELARTQIEQLLRVRE